RRCQVSNADDCPCVGTEHRCKDWTKFAVVAIVKCLLTVAHGVARTFAAPVVDELMTFGAVAWNQFADCGIVIRRFVTRGHSLIQRDWRRARDAKRLPAVIPSKRFVQI